jgi:hypothetical protein
MHANMGSKGAYLFQIIEATSENGKVSKEEHVVEYWPRSVPAPMRNYDARRLELLAAILALEYFRPFIDGVRVSLDTDHRDLAFLQNVKHSTGQLARWATRLSEFNFDLRYRQGAKMQVADCLSRNALGIEPTKEELATGMHVAHVSEVETEPEENSLFQVTFERRN